jgi:hypothetical protein
VAEVRCSSNLLVVSSIHIRRVVAAEDGITIEVRPSWHHGDHIRGGPGRLVGRVPPGDLRRSVLADISGAGATGEDSEHRDATHATGEHDASGVTSAAECLRS